MLTRFGPLERINMVRTGVYAAFMNERSAWHAVHAPDQERHVQTRNGSLTLNVIYSSVRARADRPSVRTGLIISHLPQGYFTNWLHIGGLDRWVSKHQIYEECNEVGSVRGLFLLLLLLHRIVGFLLTVWCRCFIV